LKRQQGLELRATEALYPIIEQHIYCGDYVFFRSIWAKSHPKVKTAVAPPSEKEMNDRRQRQLKALLAIA